MTTKEFIKLSKPELVRHTIELMVWVGWDITPFVYGFKSYTKESIILKYFEILKDSDDPTHYISDYSLI